MRNKRLLGISFSLKAKVVVDVGDTVAAGEIGVSILLLHYCSIPGIG